MVTPQLTPHAIPQLMAGNPDLKPVLQCVGELLSWMPLTCDSSTATKIHRIIENALSADVSQATLSCIPLCILNQFPLHLLDSKIIVLERSMAILLQDAPLCRL